VFVFAMRFVWFVFVFEMRFVGCVFGFGMRLVWNVFIFGMRLVLECVWFWCVFGFGMRLVLECVWFWNAFGFGMRLVLVCWFRHRKKLLSDEETIKIVALAEEHAGLHGWTVKRHDNYATTDIPVASDARLYFVIRF
jgi:hypothetical protein